MSAELDRLTAESEYKASGFLKRVHELNLYKAEKQLRSGSGPEVTKVDDDEEQKEQERPIIDWNKPFVSTKTIF